MLLSNCCILQRRFYCKASTKHLQTGISKISSFPTFSFIPKGCFKYSNFYEFLLLVSWVIRWTICFYFACNNNKMCFLALNKLFHSSFDTNNPKILDWVKRKSVSQLNRDRPPWVSSDMKTPSHIYATAKIHIYVYIYATAQIHTHPYFFTILGISMTWHW